MKVFKNLFGRGDKIHVDEIAVVPDLLLGSAVIVESGSNANGHYVRFGDGTQVCWTMAVDESVAANTTIIKTWAYPKAFIDSPAVVPGGGPRSQAGVVVRGITIALDTRSAYTTNTQTVIMVDNNHGASLTVGVFIVAIGRWK